MTTVKAIYRPDPIRLKRLDVMAAFADRRLTTSRRKKGKMIQLIAFVGSYAAKMRVVVLDRNQDGIDTSQPTQD